MSRAVRFVMDLERGLYSSQPSEIFDADEYFAKVLDAIERQKAADGGVLYNKGVLIYMEYPVVTDYNVKIIKLTRSDVVTKLRSGEFELTFASVLHTRASGTYVCIKGEDAHYILSMDKRCQASTLIVHETEDALRSDDHQTHYYGPCSYHVSHCTPLPSVTYPLPETCTIMMITGRDAWDMKSVVCNIMAYERL